MGNKFFLKITRDDSTYKILLAIIGWLGFIIYTIIKNEFRISYIFILCFLLCCALCERVDNKKSGLYINETNIVYKTLFRKKQICINDICCIKVLPDKTIGLGNSFESIKDENGNTLFCMHFCSRYYEKDEMDGYGFIEEIKRMFIEKQLARCIYNKEALDYILTLNPNIKVVYYDEK